MLKMFNMMELFDGKVSIDPEKLSDKNIDILIDYKEQHTKQIKKMIEEQKQRNNNKRRR